MLRSPLRPLLLLFFIKCTASDPTDSGEEISSSSDGSSGGVLDSDTCAAVERSDAPLFAVEVNISEHTSYASLDALCNANLPSSLTQHVFRAMMLEDTIWPGAPLEEPASRLPQVPHGVEFMTLCKPGWAGEGVVGDYVTTQ